MLKTNFQQEFIRLAMQLESTENQLFHTFVMKEKDELRKKIKDIKKSIDNILDEYNKENVK